MNPPATSPAVPEAAQRVHGTVGPFVRRKLFRSVDVVRIDFDGGLTVFCPKCVWPRQRMKRVSKPKKEPSIYWCKKCNETWELQ